MHKIPGRFLLIGSLAAIAAAQTPAPTEVDRVFYLTHTDTPQEMQEIATVVRAVGDIPKLFVVTESKALTVHGTGGQLAIADWLVGELNRTAPVQPTQNTTAHEYRVPGDGDDVLRVFYLANAPRPQDLQEVVTAVRSVVDVQRIFIYNNLSAVAVRGTAAQIAMVEWLVNELDKPAQTKEPGPHQYRMPGNNDQMARVFYLSHVTSPQGLQEIATAVRTSTDMRRLFINNLRKALAVRGTPEQIASAEKLIAQLDRAR
jgi:hypothetical protein